MTFEQTELIRSQPRGPAFYTGWVLSLLPALFMLLTAGMGIVNPKMMEEGMDQHGFPRDTIWPIVIVEIACLIIYLIPPTAVLGAVLLTGYLGGAVVTHVRVHEMSWFMPVVFGVLFWLGLFLRDARVRALLPIRRSVAVSNTVLPL